MRCVQGHSGATGAHINHDLLCTRLTNAALDGILILIHHTKSQYIAGMIGWNSHPGILPGGLGPTKRGKYSGRTDVHASDRPFSSGQFPDGFNRPGTDCAVHIDAELMLKDGRRIYRGPAGVILIPEAVPIKYIVCVIMARLPLITLFRRHDPEKASNQTDNTEIACPHCASQQYNLGTCFCIAVDGCHQPLTCTAPSPIHI